MHLSNVELIGGLRFGRRRVLISHPNGRLGITLPLLSLLTFGKPCLAVLRDAVRGATRSRAGTWELSHLNQAN